VRDERKDGFLLHRLLENADMAFSAAEDIIGRWRRKLCWFAMQLETEYSIEEGTRSMLGLSEKSRQIVFTTMALCCIAISDTVSHGFARSVAL